MPRPNREQSQPPARSQLALGALSHIGMVRKSNQDFYSAMLAPNAPPGTGGLLVVADGVGGQQAGEKASRQAVQTVLQVFRAPAAGPPGAGPVDRVGQMKLAIERANEEVSRAASSPETRGMATTLVAAVVEGPKITVGNVGDSRCYILRGDVMRQVTRDHSFVAEEVARGAITPEEARNHPRRNMLTRAVGINGRVEPDIFEVDAALDDVLMLCSDGLHGMVTDEEIATVLRTEEPGEAAEALVAMANEAGGKDNVTVVVAKMLSLDPPPLEAPEESSARTVAPGGARRGRGPLATAAGLLLRPFRRKR